MVHLVEREQELVEDAVLAPVARLELADRHRLVDQPGQRAVDAAGGQQAAVGGQVDAGGEHRVDEAGRVADQEHAGAGERRLVVRVVLADAQLAVLAVGDPGGAGQVLRYQGALGYQGRERALAVALDLVRHVAPYHRAHAGQGGAERDVPEPAAVEGDREDVAGVRLGQPLAALEVAEQGEAAEELRVLPFAAHPLEEPALVARGVHHVRRVRLAPGPVGVGVAHAPYPLGVLDHVRDGAALAHHRAGPAGVPQQDLVELRALHLIRVRGRPGHAFRDGEGERPRLGRRAPAEGAAPLAGEARRRQVVRDPGQPAHPVHRRRQQRLADLVAGEELLLQHQYPVSLPRHQRGQRRAGRPAADDHHVERLRASGVPCVR